MKSYDLRREVKALASVSTTGLATETTLEAIRVLTESLDNKDFATELTLALIKANSDKFTFTGGKLDVNASVSAPTGIKRPIASVEILVDGNTTDDVISVSIWFDGKNGTLNGVSVPDGYVANFSANGSDTVGSIAYTVPNTKGLRVVINYVYKL